MPKRRCKEVEKRISDLPIELLGSILCHVQSGCNDRSPVCFGLACKATQAAYKRHFIYLKAEEAEGRELVAWLARKYPRHAARVLLESGAPDPAAALSCLAAAATKDYMGDCQITEYV
jgi:hypothetical protein